MNLRPDEISSLIKEQLKNYKSDIEKSNDVGTILTVGDGIAMVYGLENAMLGELLVFPNDIYGMVMNLEEDNVGVVLLGSDLEIKEGDIVKRTRQVVEVPVGDALLGRVVNALGQPIDGKGIIKTSETRPIERSAPSIMDRQSVNSPLETGIKVIDSMIPIGKGQRELIIGDRQTGKTAIAIDSIINQKGKNVICIYVAIGQKNSSVANIYEKLKQFGCMDYTVVVDASISEPAPMLYISPFSGMAMAEYWMYQGKDVLIVFDDLYKHAISYRSLSLLLKRNPGREAFPGDIFYLHSRLLERSAKLNPVLGGGSITALPIVETLAGDISAYIPTNIISITDGQIFLSTSLFNSGIRPAVDTGLSVSRVGSSAQYRAMKKVTSSLKMIIANYNELKSFSQFGSDIDENTKKTLNFGENLISVLKQDQYTPYQLDQQVIEFFCVKYNFLNDLKSNEVNQFLKDLYKYIKDFHSDILEKIIMTHDIKKPDRDNLRTIITTFKNERKAIL
ncbi:MAG TPA: F0F1 ATP synthase subunit alpha [Firmicutes bacterium]|nr:F0F1 ATP synthase subunit alpha [Bacillota bacterium]